MTHKKYGTLKLVWHREKLESLLEGRVTAPVYVRVKPTNRCDHFCFYCVYNPDFSGIHSEINKEDEIPREKMMEILSDFAEMGVKAVTYSGGGEPLVYPYIEETLERTLELGIDLSIITNGQRLNGRRAEILANAHWVRISSDTSNAKTFAQVTRCPEKWFGELKDNIVSFAKIKKPHCELGVNFVVHEKNKDAIYEAAKFYRDLGIEYIRFGPLWSPNFEEYHAPFKEHVIEQIERAKQELTDESFEVSDSYKRDFESCGTCQRTYARCYFMQVAPAIGADSVVYFCHNKVYSKDGVLGSIKDISFKDLWFSETAAEIMRNVDPRERCKHQCTNDEKNVLYNEIMDCAGKGVNFV